MFLHRLVGSYPSTESEAEFNLELLAEKWDGLYPSISKSWRARLSPHDSVICFPRGHSASVIYTTNAIESVNMTLRKVTRNHRIFPSDEAVYKVIAPFYAKYCQEMDHAHPRLETSPQSVCHGVCRTVSGATRSSR